MINFCTLFDSNYILFGLTLYNSLKCNCKDFHLYIFAFDTKSYDVLKKLNLTHATIISLEEFEDEELLRVKPNRSRGEYCWTCTSSTVLYAIKRYNLESCTYIDADLYFYNDPKVLIDEMGDKSVLITDHRYTPKYDQSEVSGKYCVQFITFKNNYKGLKVLDWWRNACIEWCYARFEDGKFGDQKYLDDWTTRFEDVHDLMNLGGGVAPWNVQQYKFTTSVNEISGEEIRTAASFRLVFYHFHGLKLLKGGNVDLCNYQLTDNIIQTIYKPYIKKLIETREWLRSMGFSLNLDYNYKPKKTIRHFLASLKRILQGSYQVYPIKKLLK